MEQLNAELARVTAERRRLQRQATSRESRLRARRERALRVGTIAFCHDPTAGSSLATAILRTYGDCVALDVPHCVAELENRFLKTPVETLAQWLDWEGEVPEPERLEAKRLVEDVQLLSWVHTQNDTQGVSPPPQFVWERRCALSIEKSNEKAARAQFHQPSRSTAARKWLQRFRRRWGLVLGRQATHDILSVDSMRSKVNFFLKVFAPFYSECFSFGVRKTDPFSGPQVQMNLNRGGQKAAPF